MGASGVGAHHIGLDGTRQISVHFIVFYLIFLTWEFHHPIVFTHQVDIEPMIADN